MLSLAQSQQARNNVAGAVSRLGHVRIGTILPAIITALVLLGLASAGFVAYQAIVKRQESEAFLKVNRAAQLLLRSAGQWAVERGMTNAALLNLTKSLSAEFGEDNVLVNAICPG